MPRLLLPLLLLALSACAGGGGDLGGALPPSSAPGTPGASPSQDAEYVGLTEQEALARARAAGVPARVVERDGERLTLTMDYREDRRGFVVTAGRVTAVRRG